MTLEKLHDLDAECAELAAVGDEVITGLSFFVFNC